MLELPERGTATRLVLVRHAETEESARGRLCGRLDVALSPGGRRRAEELGGLLGELSLAAVYASPLERALATARPLAAAYGVEPLPLAALRELDFGELEGVPYEEVAAARPELVRLWVEDPGAVRFPGGESLAELRDRVLPAVADLRRRHAGEAVAVVAHGGPIRVVLADVLGLPDAALFRIDQPYGAVSVVDWAGPVPVVRVAGAVLYSPP